MTRPPVRGATRAISSSVFRAAPPDPPSCSAPTWTRSAPRREWSRWSGTAWSTATARPFSGRTTRRGSRSSWPLLSGLKADAIPHGPIEILFTVQEEVGLFGAKYLQADLKADFGYILDGDGPVGNIINRAPSKVDLDFVVEGKAAHAGRPDTGINAIVAASSAIARLRTGRIDAETTSNVGVISGGKARNIVPDRAEVADRGPEHRSGEAGAGGPGGPRCL